MRILIVHNSYAAFSGEEAVVEGNCQLLESHGHEVARFTRSSEEISQMRFGSARAFLSGIYNPVSKRQMRAVLRNFHPDIVHVHNLFPLISPAVLAECTKAGVPVVMTVHNYRLVCPTGLHLYKERICEKCVGGREYWCVLQNCERNLAKSLGYALRNFSARMLRSYRDHVTLYLCLTEFQRQRLAASGFPGSRMIVLPNTVASIEHTNGQVGEYVGFLGRLSPEKGISNLLDAAIICADIPFKLAGRFDRMSEMLANRPKHVELLGHLTGQQLDDFLRHIRILVLPSTCFEGFPDVIVRGMMHGKPVVCSRIGGLPEIVDDGKTGLLCEPGNSRDLAQKLQFLWDRPDLCRQMGEAGREKALRVYSDERYYERLLDAYRKAIAFSAREDAAVNRP